MTRPNYWTIAPRHRKRHRASVRAGIAARKAAGQTTCPPPYGFDNGLDGTLQHNAAEQAVIERMFELRALGYGSSAIASWLNSQGIKPRRGREWRHASIDQIITRIEGKQ